MKHVVLQLILSFFGPRLVFDSNAEIANLQGDVDTPLEAVAVQSAIGLVPKIETTS